METVLTVIAAVMLAWLVATVVGFLVVRQRLRRRNRVVADTASPTPMSWLASPSAPARLHRRLQAAVAVATSTPSELTGIIDVRADLRHRALELDRRLATAGRARGPRHRALLREVATEIDDLDALAHRVDRLASQTARALPAPGDQPELDRLSEQLQTYEDAADELAAIEREVQRELGT